MKSVSSHSTKLYCRIALFCISKTSWSNWYSKESFIKSSYGLIFIFFKALNTLRQKVNFKCLYKVARKVELDKKNIPKHHQRFNHTLLTSQFFMKKELWQNLIGRTWLSISGSSRESEIQSYWPPALTNFLYHISRIQVLILSTIESF